MEGLSPARLGSARGARWHDGEAIEINPDTTEVTPFVHYKLPLRAVDAMSRIWRALGYQLPV